MSVPRQAVILAAGYGTRLDPLTRKIPKCMLPLWTRPLIDHTLHLLASWGVRDILVNLHHAPQPLFDHLRNLAIGGARIAFSHEPEILGTGGALRRAQWFLSGSPFWMLNGDVALHASPRPLLRALGGGAGAALLMTDRSGPRTVELAPDGAVRTFHSATPGVPGTFTFCGVQVLTPDAVAELPDRPFSSIIEAYERLQARGGRVVGVALAPSGYWADIGTPEGLLAAHADTGAARRRGLPAGALASAAALQDAAVLRRTGVRASGVLAIGADVRIARGAHVENAVILEGAQLGPHADVRNAIVGPLVHCNTRLRRLGVALKAACDPELKTVAMALGWPQTRTTVQPLPPRGSSRTFTRITCDDRSAIVIRYSLERPENARYAGHARALARCSIPVPRVLLDWQRLNLTVMEDLGEGDLGSAAAGKTHAALVSLYRPVVAAVAHWHTHGAEAVRLSRIELEPAFTPALFRWERELFRTQYLRGRLRLPAADYAGAMRELTAIGAMLDGHPTALLHRDLQSSNVFLTPRGPVLIDFQGMRLGPQLYDVASLLADPYVQLAEPVQLKLLAAYAASRGMKADDTFTLQFWQAAVQRLVQALGAYGRLSRLPGMSAFARHIIPALTMLDRACGHVYTLRHLPALVRRLRAMEDAKEGA